MLLASAVNPIRENVLSAEKFDLGRARLDFAERNDLHDFSSESQREKREDCIGREVGSAALDHCSFLSVDDELDRFFGAIFRNAQNRDELGRIHALSAREVIRRASGEVARARLRGDSVAAEGLASRRSGIGVLLACNPRGVGREAGPVAGFDAAVFDLGDEDVRAVEAGAEAVGGDGAGCGGVVGGEALENVRRGDEDVVADFVADPFLGEEGAVKIGWGHFFFFKLFFF